MELDKKKYTKAEVEEIVSKITMDYDNVLVEQKSRIIELNQEVEKLTLQVQNYRDNEELISKSIKKAEKQASETEKELELQYELELESLKNFSARIKDYFSIVQKQFPDNNAVLRANKLTQIIDNALIMRKDKKMNAKSCIVEVNGVLKSETFNPKKKIMEYIASTESNGFNLDEVLNPGELQLEELCKELGLMPDEE